MRKSRASSSAVEEQKRGCPLCGELKTLRGLHGHLRLKHHKEETEIEELVNQAPLDRGGDAEEILTLLDLLKHLYVRSEWVEILAERDCFESEEIESALMQAIQGEGREIFQRLAEKGVQLGNADIEAYCMQRRERRDEEQEEEIEEDEHAE